MAHREGISADEAVAKLIGYRTIHRDVRNASFSTLATLIPTLNLQKPWQARGFHPDRLREGRVSHLQVDDGMLHLDDEDVYDFKVDFPEHEERARQTDMTVSLVDIAKPARRRGKLLSLALRFFLSNRNEFEQIMQRNPR